MTENSDMERQVYNGIMRMNEALYLESVMTADSRLESILWVLYAAYKGIPLRSKSDSDLDFLSNEEKYIYMILRSHIENHLQQSHVLHILEDAFYHFTRIDQDYFKSAYPDALSFVFQYSYERSGRMAADFGQPAGLSYLVAEILNGYHIHSLYIQLIFLFLRMFS